MRKFTYAWLTFRAIMRLDESVSDLSERDRRYTDGLIHWLMEHKDSVIQGTWYPNLLFRGMNDAHKLRYTPSKEVNSGKVIYRFRKLPPGYLSYHYRDKSPVSKLPFTVEPNDFLPDRCQALALSVIDLFKIQANEDKGSPICPNDNQIAHMFFMLSHYIADAHNPFNCDSRNFSEGKNILGRVERQWETNITKYMKLDGTRTRFQYDLNGYPMLDNEEFSRYESSFLYSVDDELKSRRFSSSFGADNKNIGDFIEAICQYSYLISYSFIPQGYDHTNTTGANWKSLGAISLHNLSVAVFADAIDSIARVFFRIWRHYANWYISSVEKKTRQRSLRIPI